MRLKNGPDVDKCHDASRLSEYSFGIIHEEFCKVSRQFRYVQIVRTEQIFSNGIATEELEMAEERGFLCREQALGGILFWENHLIPHK